MRGPGLVWDRETTSSEVINLLLDGKRGLVVLHLQAPEKSNPPGALPWRGVAGVVRDIIGLNLVIFKAGTLVTG